MRLPRKVPNAAVACLLGVTAACTTETGPAPRPEPPRLAASASQPRADEGTDLLRTAVINEGDRAVPVRSVALAWPGFAGPEAVVDERLAPGGIVGVALHLGEARCHRRVTPSPALTVVLGDGRATAASTHRVPLPPDDAGTVRRLHERACRARRLAETASVTLRLRTSTVPRAGHVLGAVVLRRRPGAEAAVGLVDVAGSVLLRLVPAHPDRLPAVLGPGRRVARIPVRVVPTDRCDPHALTNSSQTFLFSLYVRVADQPAQRVVRFPTAAEKEVLARALERACPGG